MSFHHRKKHKEEDLEAWLMTYADMITLLLCFFAILLSVMEPKKEKLDQLKEGIMSKFQMVQTASPFTAILESLQSIIEDQHLERDISVEQTDRGLILELSTSSFYQSGSAQLKPEAIPTLDKILQSIQAAGLDKYTVEVEGHTDDVPIKTAAYPSNWELSTNRATGIVRFFIERGVPADHLKAAGYAEVKPKVPNLDQNGNPIPANREINRRIVIKLEQKI